MSYKLYYATEENCFEGEKICEAKSLLEIKLAFAKNLDTEVEDATRVNEILGDFTDEGVSFENDKGYYVTYIITTDGRKARGEISRLRDEYLSGGFC